MKGQSWFATLAAIAAVGAVTIGGARAACAQSDAIASGDWSAAGTWNPAEPGAGDLARINGSFTVDVDSAGEVAGILDLGTIATETGNLTVDAPGTLTVSTTMRLGQVANTTGNVTMTGGEVTVNGLADSGFGDGDLIVGDNGTGTYTQSGGDTRVADEIVIGLSPTSTGVVNISGGTFQTGVITPPAPPRPNGRSIIVGFDGKGTLNVSGTASVRANFDVFVGFVEGSVGEFNLSGGTVEAGIMFSNFLSGGAGSTATMNQTGGTFNTRIAYVIGQGNGTTLATHSGGTINAMLGNGEFVVGDGPGNSSTYNVSGTADVNVLRNFVAGRDGIGVVNMSGGTIDAENVFLGDFDSSLGTLKISGGTLSLTGNVNVGAALASNAPADGVRLGDQGQALGAKGNFHVVGNGGTINVAGDFLANAADRTRPGTLNESKLTFELLSAAGTSLINVTSAADLDGSVIDMMLTSFTPTPGASFDLLTALGGIGGDTGTGTTKINGSTGEAYTLSPEDVGLWTLSVRSNGGLSETLVAKYVPEPSALALAGMSLLVLTAGRRRCGG
jgi:hypothetical protein